MTSAQLQILRTEELVALLDKINEILWKRHSEEYAAEGLETLTSAVEELHRDLV